MANEDGLSPDSLQKGKYFLVPTPQHIYSKQQGLLSAEPSVYINYIFNPRVLRELVN